MEYIFKGMNNRTEMYSALLAEVEDRRDPSTGLNTELLLRLSSADHVIVCGQARSHCVNFTFRDILRYWPANRASKLILLRDGTCLYDMGFACCCLC